MKKLLVVGLALLLLTGCTEKTEKTVRTYTKSGEDSGDTYEITNTVTAIEDRVVYEKTVTKYTLTSISAERAETYKENLDETIACPYGVLDDEGKLTVGCSKYIKMSYTYDEETKTFVITEEFDYKAAAEAKEDIKSEEAGGYYDENAYYSLSKFEEDFLASGYEIQE